MYPYPAKKRYKYIIPTIKGDCVLEFEQATAKETSEYMEIIDMLVSDDMSNKIKGIILQKKYILDFLLKSYNVKRYSFKKKRILRLVIESMEYYIGDILWMLHPLWDSIYKWVDMPKTVNGKKPNSNPFDNHLEVICKKTGIAMDQLYDRLTTEQIGRYLDKTVYESYEMFKEWQAINMKVIASQWLDISQKRDLDIIKNNRKYFNNK